VPLIQIPLTFLELEHKFDVELKQEIKFEEYMREDINQRVVIPPWLSQGALNLAEPLHEIPRKLKNFSQNLTQTKPTHQKTIQRISS